MALVSILGCKRIFITSKIYKTTQKTIQKLLRLPVYYEGVCHRTTICVAELKIGCGFVVDGFLEKFEQINFAVNIVQIDKY